jgi:hypothetical protein
MASRAIAVGSRRIGFKETGIEEAFGMISINHTFALHA